MKVTDNTKHNPLNQAELNFIELYGLTVHAYHNRALNVSDANGRNWLIDREASFIDWAKQVKAR